MRGTFLFAKADITGHALQLLLGYQRTDLRLRVEPIADPQPLTERGYAADEFVVHLLLHKKPGASAANLAGIGEHRHGGTGHS